ncbi:response regulator [Chitinophaga japonensis]|uniref:Response regulator receiver domain-containing protein n=1 Tax=Chitinophaga japonensis TaxID=104662 RepID=A0A562T3X8_CHIJA|nr:response regulator [Chitinophaga japonensis]TWI88239.1 response regulator receiver domain-containing protein [Chitinophaga japonensis]
MKPKINVVLVENDEDEQLFMKEGFLSTDLFNILAVAGNGEEALAAIYNGQPLPDLVISDLNMPGKNGLDLLLELKSDAGLSHIPVIIISTSFTSTIINKCMSSGAHAYHTKPDSFIEYDKFAQQIYLDWHKDKPSE